MEKRNRYTPEFKAKIVMEVLREEETVNQIAGKYSLSPHVFNQEERDKKIKEIPH
jgi:transposase-like protein